MERLIKYRDIGSNMEPFECRDKVFKKLRKTNSVPHIVEGGIFFTLRNAFSANHKNIDNKYKDILDEVWDNETNTVRKSNHDDMLFTIHRVVDKTLRGEEDDSRRKR